MQIALDAMGGDLGPQELISGALLAVERDDLSILLVGNEQVLSEHLEASPASKSLRERLAIVHADTVVEMDENPVDAIRKKKDSSIMVAFELVKARDGHDPDPEMTARLTARALENGLVILSCGYWGNTVCLLAPLTIPRAQLEEGLDIIEASLEQLAA